MAISQKELGSRIQMARKGASVTQDQLADRVGIPRSAVSQIESGNRAVSGIELDTMAEMLGVDIRSLLSNNFSEDSPMSALFRAEPTLAEAPGVSDAIRRCLKLARETANLEGLLGVSRAGVGAQYSMPTNGQRSRAVDQARQVAEQERHRMGLGDQPVPDLTWLLEDNGVRVTFADLPSGVSGITLATPEAGAIIVVNGQEPVQRRRFSLAHEYGHVVMHRDKTGMVSRADDGGNLAEIQANVFAANFLVPSYALFSYLDSMGKRRMSEPEAELYDSEGERLVSVRAPVAAPTPEMQDVVKLASHFGVSRHMIIVRLDSLRVVTREEAERLLAMDKAGHGARMERLLGLTPARVENAKEHIANFASLALEAYRRDRITRGKLMELLSEVKGVEEMEQVERSMMEGEEFDLLEPSF